MVDNVFSWISGLNGGKEVSLVVSVDGSVPGLVSLAFCGLGGGAVLQGTGVLLLDVGDGGKYIQARSIVPVESREVQASCTS